MAATTSEMNLVVKARNLASRQLAAVGNDLDRLNRKSGVLKTGFSQLKRIAAVTFVAVGAAVVGGIAKGIGAFAEFDSKLNQSLAIMGDVSDEMRQKMSDAAREVGKNTLIGASEAAEAYFFLASAGLDAEQSIAALPQVAAFAQAGMFDMSTATDLATDAQSALGLTVKDAGQNLENLTRVTDVLVKANTLANATVEQFSTSLTNKAGTALKLVNKDIEEGVAVLAVFADQGIKGQVAGENLSRALKGLQINANANADAFADMGIRVFDSEGNMRNMADIVDDVTAALDGLSDKEKTQALLDLGFSARQQDVIKMLIGTGDQIRDYEEALRDAGGTTKEVAEKQLNTINAKWEIFKSRIHDVFIGLGEQLAPAVGKVLDKLADWAEKWGPKILDWLKDAFKFAVRWGKIIIDKIVGAVKAVVKWFKNLDPEVQNAIKFGVIFAGVVLGLALAVGVLTTVLGILFSPVVLIVGALIAIGAALKLAYDRFEWFRNLVDAVVAWFRDDFLDTMKNVWNTVVSAIQTALDFIIPIVQAFISFFQDLWARYGEKIIQVFVSAWDMIWAYIQLVTEAVKIIIGAFVEAVMWIWDHFGEQIVASAQVFWDYVKNLIDAVLDIIIGIFDFFKAVFTGKWGDAWNALKDIAKGAWDAFVAFIESVWDTFKIWWEKIWGIASDFFKTIWDNLAGIVGNAWNAFVSWLSDAWNLFTGWWSDVWNTLAGAVGTAFDTVLNVIKGVLNKIIGAIEGGINIAIRGINGLIRGYNKIPFAPNISTLSHVNIPRLAEGTNRVMRKGLAIVGDAGPELMELPVGARVSPLRPGPVLAPTPSSGVRDVHIHLHGVDLTDPARKTLERVRDGLRNLELEDS